MSVSGASRPGASRPRPARAALLAAACASAAVVPSLVAVAAAGPAQAASVVTVSSLGSSGAGSLRAAISAANAGPAGAATTIKFSVHGTITLASALPGITSRVTIDGTSAPTYASGGAPVVAIDCNGRAGLRFAAGSARSQLLAVAVDDASGDGVTLNAGRITLNLNYIGLDLTGAAAGNHGDGVLVNLVSSGNRIGLNPSRDSGVVANVISGNTGDGIALNGSSGNTIAANRIGTSPAGTARIRNGGNGISLTSRASDNEIGGTAFVDHATGQANNPTGSKGTVTPVFVVPPLGNLISGNGGNGVWIATNANRNSLNGNFVGTTANGNAALGNALSGVWIDGADGNSLTGCRFVNNPFVYYNVLSGNGRNGLRVTDAANTTVQGNFLGTGANNSTVVANRRDGVRIDGSSVNAQVGGVIPLGNVSAGNGRNGIEVAGTASGFTTFNTFGGLFAFGGAAPNGRDGLLITSTGGGNLVRTNVMSGNTRNGIEIGGNASGVTVVPDIAGLNTSGNATLPNGGDGLRIDGTAHGNTIGGTLRSVIPQNTFSGNAGYGIAITRRAHANKVILSYIGTSLLGTTAMGNQKGGILIGGSASRNQIGALDLHPANLISGNTGNGVTLRSGTRANLVLRNYIGLNRFARSLPNSGSPVVDNGTANIIRGNRT